MPNKPLTDAIDALTAYANEVTGESDTTLSEAVHTLADGYGQGGGDTIWAAIVDGTVTEANDKDGLCKGIRQYSFYQREHLLSVNLPSAENVGSFGFYNCSALTSVNLPSVTRIGTSGFTRCMALTSLDFSSLAWIGSDVFTGCTKLKSLILRKLDSICTLSNTNSFGSTPIKSGTGYIYVPASLLETYKADSNWKTYAAQFRALEDYTVDGTTTGDLDPNKI